MSSIIVQTTTRLIILLMFVLSIFMMLRGHNLPGGGFIGGLIAGGALGLHLLAFGYQRTRDLIRVRWRYVAGFGLALALISGVVSLYLNQPFMTGQWVKLELGHTVVKLGTPMLFDFGVYVTVISSVLILLLNLSEDMKR